MSDQNKSTDERKVRHNECAVCECMIANGSGGWVAIEDYDELARECAQLRLDLAQHNGNATAVLQAQHERDCAVEDVKRLSDALQVLLDEQNDAPLERRRAEWQHACDSARSALRVDVPAVRSTEFTCTCPPHLDPRGCMAETCPRVIAVRAADTRRD